MSKPVKIKVFNQNELDGNGQVLTELSIQGFDRLEDILRPMGFDTREMYYILESVSPNWEDIDYLYNLYLAWSESEEN